MSNFLKNYNLWEQMGLKDKRGLIVDCASFYEEKALDYILSNLPKKKQKEFTKEPLKVEFVNQAKFDKDVSFGNNEVYVLNDIIETGDKKSLFFKVARNTICAVFVNLFYNTASDPAKKTSFGNLANGFFASITNEFAKGKEFENDMMQAYEQILGEVMDMGPAME